MSERVALATLALGRRYEHRWRRVCEPLWRAYAERHDYEVICLTAPLDDSDRARARSPAWQKCLILEQPIARDFDRVVWVDADVAIRPEAPPIHAGVPRELVGAVDEYSSPTRELHDLTLAKLYAHWESVGVPYVDNPTPADYYAAWGLAPRFDRVVQTGVMVLSPDHHAAILRRTYDRYEDRGAPLNYEMRPLSWELLDADAVHWLSPPSIASGARGRLCTTRSCSATPTTRTRPESHRGPWPTSTSSISPATSPRSSCSATRRPRSRSSGRAAAASPAPARSGHRWRWRSSGART